MSFNDIRATSRENLSVRFCQGKGKTNISATESSYTDSNYIMAQDLTVSKGLYYKSSPFKLTAALHVA